MIRLKKKAEAKAVEAAAAPTETKSESTAEDNADGKSGEGLKLFGIGGKGGSGNEEKKVGKKRTPGEIRIQKGELLVV